MHRRHPGQCCRLLNPDPTVIVKRELTQAALIKESPQYQFSPCNLWLKIS